MPHRVLKEESKLFSELVVTTFV